MGATSEVRGHA